MLSFWATELDLGLLQKTATVVNIIKKTTADSKVWLTQIGTKLTDVFSHAKLLWGHFSIEWKLISESLTKPWLFTSFFGNT